MAINSPKIAVLLRGGMLPQAYVSPAKMRATRDLLRRRMDLTRKRAELLAHMQHTHSQDNLPEIGKKLADTANRDGVAERFPDPAVPQSMEVDLALLGYYDPLLNDLEAHLVKAAKQHDAKTLSLLQTVPGEGLRRHLRARGKVLLALRYAWLVSAEVCSHRFYPCPLWPGLLR